MTMKLLVPPALQRIEAFINHDSGNCLYLSCKTRMELSSAVLFKWGMS